jgi:hypothetical protein
LKTNIFLTNQATLGFRKQTQALVSCVDVWWHLVLNSLLSCGLSADEKDWMLSYLLPTVYWHQQMEKTKDPWRRTCYKKAWEEALQNGQNHPLTATLSTQYMEKHLQWAIWIVGHFLKALLR